MNSRTVSLPVEHFAQLQALAQRDGVTIVETIADFLHDAIGCDRIPDTLPGWTVQHRKNGVLFAVEDTSIERTLAKAHAASLAESLDALSVPGRTAKAVLDVDLMLKLERRGIAVKLTDVETGEERAVARSVAKDLARLLRGEPLRAV